MILRKGKTIFACLAFLAFLWGVRPPAATGEGTALPAPASITPGGVGRIQRIQGDDIVIQDQLYKLVSWTCYATPENKAAGKDGFGAGDLVLFEFSSRKEILLLRRME